MSQLAEIYSHKAVREFGQALRRALRTQAVQDFASLIDLENAETEEAFAEAIRKFLRRNFRHAEEQGWFWPGSESLEELMRLANNNGVPLVRAALISHALTWEPQEGRVKGKEETNV